ncbi:hypothetical protein IT408_00670 [Candidatus Uhrbacteria bacterium]|nr:hypothetical protein [Candidatus Uhrbacteria bacterium]
MQLVPINHLYHYVQMIRYIYIGLIISILGSTGYMVYASQQVLKLQPQMSVDPAHHTLLRYANAIEHFDEDEMFETICDDSAPENVIRTFFAIGEDGRHSTAVALRAAVLDNQLSTENRKIFSMKLQTPQGEKIFPLKVILLNGKWCIDETET